MTKHRGWIAVGLDSVLAEYVRFEGAGIIGPPVPAMVTRVKAWLAEGRDVRILTARISHDGTAQRMMEAQQAHRAVERWCELQVGRVMPVTCMIDFKTTEVWLDRAVQVIPNTGIRVDGRE